LVVLCLLLASVAHAKESGKPSNCQTSGSADSCPASEKTLLTRRARNIQEGLALEEARTSLIGKGEAQATLEDAKADLAGLIEQEDGDERPTRKGTDSRVKAATRTKDKIKEKRRDAKAKFGNARDKKWKLRPKVKFEKKIRAGLIEQEDGDERPTRKGTDSRVKAATAMLTEEGSDRWWCMSRNWLQEYGQNWEKRVKLEHDRYFKAPGQANYNETNDFSCMQRMLKGEDYNVYTYFPTWGRGDPKHPFNCFLRKLSDASPNTGWITEAEDNKAKVCSGVKIE